MRSTVKKKVGHGSSNRSGGARGRCGVRSAVRRLAYDETSDRHQQPGARRCLLLGVLLSVAVLFVTAIACALLAREFVLPFVLAEVVALSVAAIGFGVSNLVRK